MLRLYDHLSSGNGYKCRWLLTQLGHPFERVEMDIDAAQTRTDAFLALNPNGRIPLLRLAPGDFLAESNAILRWLAEDTSFWPDNRRDKAAVLQWLFWEQYSHEPYVAVARFQVLYLGKAVADLEPRLVERGNGALQRLELGLSQSPFLVGDKLSLADVAVVAYTRVAHEGGFSLDPYPAVKAWVARVEQTLRIG